MKHIQNLIYTIIFILFTLVSRAVSPEWVIYNNTDIKAGSSNYFVNVIALSDSSIWTCGPGHGIFIYKNGLWKNIYEFWHSVGQHFWTTGFYNIVENFQNSIWFGDANLIKMNPFDTIELHNSLIDNVYGLAVKDNYLWITQGDTNGLIRYDGTNVVTYPIKIPSIEPNIGISFSEVRSDLIGNLWLASGYGLFKFDGIQYTRYDTSNSMIPCNAISDIKFDKNGVLWLTFIDVVHPKSEVAKFDGNNWTIYNSSNSSLPSDTTKYAWALRIAVDSLNNKWIGTGKGLFKFDGTNWTEYNVNNSGLPDNSIQAISVDKLGNLWIATSNGLAIFKEGGVNLPTGVSEEKKDIPSFSVFPNPSENTIKIKYTNDMSGQVKITLTDMNGDIKVEQVRNSEVSGEQTDIIDTSTLQAGTYFVKVDAGKVSAVNKVVIVK